MADGSARTGIEVLHRAFAVLDALGDAPGGMASLAVVARRVELPKPTVHRLLATLVSIGVVERAGQRYQLGMHLFELGQAVAEKTDLREAALPFMEDLYEATHEIVHLAVLDGIEVLYLERIRGHRSMKLASKVGGRQPAHCTGLGKALLAFTPEAAARVLAGPLTRRTPYTITVHAVLVDELARIRAAGVAFDRDESAVGVHCAAAPVIVGGRAVAAISVTGSPQRLDVERVAPAVRTATLGLQRKLAGV